MSQKILLGDDNIEFAKQSIPNMRDTEVTFLEAPEKVISEALSGKDYDIIITDLNYTSQGHEGFEVLEAIQGLCARKILWTGEAEDFGVSERAKQLGAEILDKDQLLTLVGVVASKAPLVEGGKILVMVRDGVKDRALKQSVLTLCDEGKIVFGTDLKSELETYQYGLVIDTSTLDSPETFGSVAHDIKYFSHLERVPKVVRVTNTLTVVVDILKIYSDFYK